MTLLECDNISISYRDKTVLKDINFSLESNEFISILGKSGSGKSTLLNIIANINTESSGIVTFSDTSKELVMVTQDYNSSIYAWRTVYQNLTLFISQKNKKTIEDVDYYLNLVGLNEVKHVLPRNLSGGMKQRIAIARAFLFGERILLLDEPFGSLDYYTKMSLERDLLKICKKLNFSVIMVTHDVEEAIFLSDRIFYLDDVTHTITKEIIVDLEYPREHLSTKVSKKFLKLKEEVLKCYIK